MGLQWANQCYCGNSYGSYGDTTGCDSCGVGLQECGGMNAVYTVTAGAPAAEPAAEQNAPPHDCHATGGGMCYTYFVSVGGSNWDTMEAYCAWLGGHLAKDENAARELLQSGLCSSHSVHLSLRVIIIA